MDGFRESYTDQECAAEFDGLFPNGFSGPDVRKGIAWDAILDLADDKPVEVMRDIRELFGRCVWDIFSNQHEVIAPDGRHVHLGSFRRAGEFIANYLNLRTAGHKFDYMSFYLGTDAAWVEEHGDLTPIYALIFGRMKSRELDWVYHFPQQICCMDFPPPPSIIRAYRNVYGKWPQGWPPTPGV